MLKFFILNPVPFFKTKSLNKISVPVSILSYDREKQTFQTLVYFLCKNCTSPTEKGHRFFPINPL